MKSKRVKATTTGKGTAKTTVGAHTLVMTEEGEVVGRVFDEGNPLASRQVEVLMGMDDPSDTKAKATGSSVKS